MIFPSLCLHLLNVIPIGDTINDLSQASPISWYLRIRVAVATMTCDPGHDFERFRVHFERLIVLARMPTYLTDIAI
jgi:hypothetical protein